jgi:hypothetical protein
MTDPNPLAGMPFAESLANQMNESMQWMSRMWGNPVAGAATGAESGFGRQSPLPPGLPSMLMPTFDPQELDKRISDLKTVEHWLDMNRALLHSTIQTLEMQRNAIVAFQAMARPAPGSASVNAPSQAGPPPAAAPASQPRNDAAAPPLPFDPTPWWNALQEQFARVAASAAKPDSAPEDPRPPGEINAAQTQPSERSGPSTAAGKSVRKAPGPSG